MGKRYRQSWGPNSPLNYMPLRTYLSPTKLIFSMFYHFSIETKIGSKQTFNHGSLKNIPDLNSIPYHQISKDQIFVNPAIVGL